MSKTLDWAIQMRTCASHAHFATFATYVGATTIWLAAVGLGIERTVAPPVIAVSCLLGMWVCFQWHLASLSHRMHCRYYLEMIKHLQQSDASSMFRVLDVKDDIERGVWYPWWAHREQTWVGVRGAGLPAVYAILFLLMGVHNGYPYLMNDVRMVDVIVVVVSFFAFILLNKYVAWERRQRPDWPDWRDGAGTKPKCDDSDNLATDASATATATKK